MLLDPCKYLEFSRNVWSVTNRSATPLSLPIVSQIANLLVQVWCELGEALYEDFVDFEKLFSCDFLRVITLRARVPVLWRW